MELRTPTVMEAAELPALSTEHPVSQTTIARPRTLSIVVPVFNEESTIVPLFNEVQQAMLALPQYAYTVLFVDDGSKDGSWSAISALHQRHPDRVRALRLRRNFGKSDALSIAFATITSDFVVTMDADLQDDPAEIPKLLAQLDAGFDLVSGWKQVRNDPLSKTLPSRLFNRVTSRLTKVELQDFNCGLKAYRAEVVHSIHIYGELHRFIPVLADNLGFRVTEIPVNHRPRQHGVSKYGLERYVRGMLDLLTVMATTRYVRRPGHLFGGLGLLIGAIGMIALVYLTAIWLLDIGAIGNRPLLLFGVLCVLVSAQLISLGIIAELSLNQSRLRPGEAQIAQWLAPESIPGTSLHRAAEFE